MNFIDIIFLILLIFILLDKSNSNSTIEPFKNDFQIIKKYKSLRFNKCLQDLKKILDDNNQEFFLSCGTLLGCIREKDFIFHDNDIDISIFYDKFDPNIKNKILESKVFKLVHELGNLDDSYELSFQYINGVRIDIFLCYKIRENYYYMPSFFGKCNDKKDKFCKWGFHIYGLIKHNFLGKEYLIPINYIQYLEENYGHDWLVPKKISYFEGLEDGYKNLIN